MLAVLQNNCQLQVNPQDAQTIINDAEGDALDAVLAAFAAGVAKAGGYAGVPAKVIGTVEGWIY